MKSSDRHIEQQEEAPEKDETQEEGSNNKSVCCNAELLDSGQCLACGADGTNFKKSNIEKLQIVKKKIIEAQPELKKYYREAERLSHDIGFNRCDIKLSLEDVLLAWRKKRMPLGLEITNIETMYGVELELVARWTMGEELKWQAENNPLVIELIYDSLK